MNNIKETIRQLAQGGRQSVSLVCTVDAVDKEARTVDCTPLDESAPLLSVNLQANQASTFGVVAFPKVGSYVVVGFVADGAAGVVLLTDEVESLEVVISEDTTRISADKDGVRVLMGEDTGVELKKKGITLNGGTLGGLVKVGELTERLNIIERDINTIKGIFNAWTPVPNDGGAALKGTSTGWSAGTLRETVAGDYENKRVTQ